MKNSISQINTLKILSAFAVFLIHYISVYNSTFNTSNALYSTILLICNFSVPMFFIISGFLHSGKNYTYRQILIKVMYFYLTTVIFNALFLFLNTYLRHSSQYQSILKIITASLQLKLVSHLWFMPCIIILYLFMPILSSLSIETKLIFTILSFILTFLKPILFKSLNFEFPLPYYFTYFLVGISYKELNKKFKNTILIICLLVFVILLLTYKESCIKYYNSIGTFFLTNIIFLTILLYLPECKLIDQISNTSYYVYITHPLFIHLIFSLLKYNPSNIVMFILMSFIIFFINVIIIKVFRRYLMYLTCIPK